MSYSVSRHNKKRKSTRLISCRIDEDLLISAKKLGINLNYTFNVLLRGYLYIQKCDKSTPIIGSSDFDPNNCHLDFYDKNLVDVDY